MTLKQKIVLQTAKKMHKKKISPQKYWIKNYIYVLQVIFTVHNNYSLKLKQSIQVNILQTKNRTTNRRKMFVKKYKVDKSEKKVQIPERVPIKF